MKNPQQEQAVKWIPIPIGPIEKAIREKGLEDRKAEKIRAALRSLKGPMRIQEDGKGQHWLVHHEEVIQGFEGLYKQLAMVEPDFELLEILKIGGLLELGLLEETQGLLLREKDIPDAEGYRSLVKATAKDYGFEDADLVTQVINSFVIHSVDFVEGLDGLAPDVDSNEVLPFLKKTTDVFRESCGGGAELLKSLSKLWASGGHRRAQRALVQKLEGIEKETGESSRETRMRMIALKSDRKEDAARYLASFSKPKEKRAKKKLGRSITGAHKQIIPARGESGRKLRRKARSGSTVKRQAKRRSRMRSRRLVAWSASGVEALPAAVREEMLAKTKRKARPSKEAEAPEKVVEAPNKDAKKEVKKETKKDAKKATSPKADAATRKDRAKAAAKAKARKEKKARQRKREEGTSKTRRKRRARTQARMRSQRLTVWSVSADDIGIAPAAKDELRKAYEAKVKAKREAAKETPEAKKAEPEKKAEKKPEKKTEAKKGKTSKSKDDKGRRRTRKAVKGAGRKRKSRRLTAQKAKKLATWSASQEMAALPAETKEQLKNQLAGPEKETPKAKAKAEAPTKRGARRKGRGKARTVARGKSKKRQKRRKTRNLKRASQSLTAWSVSQELPALPADVKGDLSTAVTPPAVDPVKTETPEKEKAKKTEVKKTEAKKKATGKATLTKRRRSTRNPMVQNAIMAGAGLFFLFFAYIVISSLDSNDQVRRDIENAVSELNMGSGFKKHDKLLNRIVSFKEDNPEGIDQDFADEMSEEVRSKINSAVKKLNNEFASLSATNLETRANQTKAEKLLSRIGPWKDAPEGAGTLSQNAESLRESLQKARKWSDFGEGVLAFARDEVNGTRYDLHSAVSEYSTKTRDKSIEDTFNDEAKKAESTGVKAILTLLGDSYFHPAFDEAFYSKLKTKALQARNNDFEGRRRQQVRNLVDKSRTNMEIAREYARVMEAAYARLDAEDLSGAVAIVKGSGKPMDYWMKATLAWLNEHGAQWIEDSRSKPEVVAKVEPEPEKTPEVEPEPEEKGPVVTAKEDTRTYKESFAEKLYQYKSARGGAKGILASEMAKVMKDSLELVDDSPAMAYDVVRFYKERKSKFSKEAELKELYKQHIEKAFTTIFPTVTGPYGFWELRDWCKDNDYKNGLSELKPILARLNPPDKGNGNYAREYQFRVKRAKINAAVEGFLSKRRVDNVKGFKKLLSFLREEGYMEDDVKEDFTKNVNLIVGKVGKDRRQAGALIKELERVPSRDLSARKKEAARKTYFSRSKKLVSAAENSLIDAVGKALKAKEPGVGYDILQDALVINPKSERAYKGLRYKKVDDDWIRPWDADMRGKGYKYDNAIGWYKGEKKDGQYYNMSKGKWEDLAAANQAHAEASNPWVFNSEHFTLKSCASLKETQLVLRRLEAFYLRLFRQFDLFFAPNGDAFTVFGLAKKAHMVVNYYRDRAQFQASANPPTQWAAGFYSGGRRASFFYSTPGSWTVLQHEIVHQILGENSRGGANSWLAEGTAVYMEDAYFNRDGQLLLGPVSKHSRPYRYLNEARNGRTTISYKEVIDLKTSAQWGAGNIGDHYKGAGAVVYFYMTFDGGRYRSTFLNYLRSCYNRGAGSELPNFFGLSHDTLAFLCERFYKQGFVYHNGRMMTHSEKAVFDREYIEQYFPDPDPNMFKKARGRKKPQAYTGEIKGLVNKLKSNGLPMEKRRQAAEALVSIGDDGKKACEDTLQTLIDKAKSDVLKKIKSKKRAYFQLMAQEILRRRKTAYDFIMDPSKYPDANHGKAAQPDVDKLVNSLRDAFANPYKVLKEEEKKLKEVVAKLDLYHDWRAELLGLKNEKKNDHEEIGQKVKDTLKMDKNPLSPQDAAIKKANQEIMAYNKRGKFLLNKEERDCCEKTNEYRMMFGLKALKFFDPLVRAARGHSKEMRDLKFFDHNSPTPANRTPNMRVSREGAKYSGENIAMGHPSGIAAFWGWYNSSGHHRNILGKTHTSIGVGQCDRYWTQNFGRDNP